MRDGIGDVYSAMVDRLEEISRLSNVIGILHWDQEVIMPSGSADSRAKQLAVLAGIHHEKSINPDHGEIIDKLSGEGESNFTQFEWCNIREAKRNFDRETKVPAKLVKEIAELSSRGHHVWSKAREENRFEDFAPVLKRLLELKKEWAHHVDPNLPSYEVNIDEYERGVTISWLDSLFDQVKAELIPLIHAIVKSDCQPDTSFLTGNFPIEKQAELGKRISKDIGFSFEKGRMDVSVHPFCGGGDSTDVRITTRYRNDNFVESLYAVIHETGHGLYEQGRMQDGKNLPASESLTMGIHESQSLFWERMIAQGKSFCSRYLDLFATVFPEKLKGISVDSFYEGINVSMPSFIRVEADEVTYPMHIILRYELEKDLFEDKIQVADLPELWNEKMKQYLGICPATDREGVLQDVHWSGGAFGYFPSYTLGAMYACQLYNSMRAEIGDVDTEIQKGNFSPVKNWLNEKIHSKGRLYSTDELILRITGELLNPRFFISYLKDKYSQIYKLNPQ